MKVYICLLLALATLVVASEPEHLEFLTDSTPALKKISDTYQVYSMVWSGKYYNNRAEKPEFFFAVPMSFNTAMKVDVAKKVISLDFVNYKKDMSNFKVLLTDAPKALASKFGPLLKFSPDFSKVDVNLDFVANPTFELSLVHIYQNKDFRNVQLKITIPTSKVDRAFYITFDLFKKDTADVDIQAFMDFCNGLKAKK